MLVFFCCRCQNWRFFLHVFYPYLCDHRSYHTCTYLISCIIIFFLPARIRYLRTHGRMQARGQANDIYTYSQYMHYTWYIRAYVVNFIHTSCRVRYIARYRGKYPSWHSTGTFWKLFKNIISGHMCLNQLHIFHFHRGGASASRYVTEHSNRTTPVYIHVTYFTYYAENALFEATSSF